MKLNPVFSPMSLFLGLSIGILSFDSFALTAPELFSRIRSHNPMVKEEEEKLKAAQSSVATYWTAPELAISEMNPNTPFADSMMKMQRTIEISQMFPNPVKISADNKIKDHSVKVQSEQIELAFKKVRREAFNTFLSIYKMSKEREILSAKKSYIEKFINRLVSGQVQGQEERIQISEARNDLAELNILLQQNQNESLRMQKMLNQMMGAELDSPVTEPELLTVDLKTDPAKGDSLELKSLNAQIAVMESEVSMKKAEFLPEFSLTAKFNKGYSMGYEDSKELMVGITLPFLFFGQQKNDVDNAHYKAEAMKYARVNLVTEIQARKAALKSELQDIAQTLKFLKESSLPLREKKFRLYAGYSYVDMNTLMNYKMSVDDLYMLKMKILEKEIEEQKKYFEWSELYN